VEGHKFARATYEIVVKTFLHNIMQGHPLPTMHAMKKVDPNRIQRMVTNAIPMTKT
jgi:hypothetical protein